MLTNQQKSRKSKVESRRSKVKGRKLKVGTHGSCVRATKPQCLFASVHQRLNEYSGTSTSSVTELWSPHLFAMFHVEHRSFLLSPFSFLLSPLFPYGHQYVSFLHSLSIHRLFRLRLIYLPIITNKMFTSLGETPGMRLAWAMVSGSVLISFWRASVEIAVMEA